MEALRKPGKRLDQQVDSRKGEGVCVLEVLVLVEKLTDPLFDWCYPYIWPILILESMAVQRQWKREVSTKDWDVRVRSTPSK